MDVQLINVFVDTPMGAGIAHVATPRSSAVPLMDYLTDAGFRITHDGWYTEAEEQAQRTAALCGYSATHKARGIAAVEIIPMGVVGDVACCQQCADFYRRLQGES